MKPDLNHTQAIYPPEGPKPKMCVTTTIIMQIQYTKILNPRRFDLGTTYTLFQNGRHLDILLFSFKLYLDASFKAKYSFEFSAQERGIKGQFE